MDGIEDTEATPRVNVLDHGWVELQDMMGSDRDVVCAARTSYLSESKGDEKDKKLLFFLMEQGHHAPFETVVFRFRLRAPVMVWWQLVRHRIASYDLQSGRYIQLIKNTDDFYVPENWRTEDGEVLYGEQALDWDARLAAYYDISQTLYQEALEDGISKEMARVFLPGFAVYYTGVWTINARSLMNFLKLRMDVHAQKEIREYAWAIYGIFKERVPWIAEAFDKYILELENEFA